MKINPPKAIIDEKDPFKHALFGRKDFAESLTGLLRNVSENLVIFVNAPWGEGKTTFAQMWRAHLQQQKLEVIYFDAYAADYFDDPFVSFSGEILGLVDKRLADGKGLVERREFKETAVEIGKRLAGLAAKIGLRAATLGAVESAHLEELKNIGSEIASGFSEIGADLIEKKIENYGIEKDALKKFKESLAKLAAKVRDEQKFPLTIIVDELDRCRPDFALGLLERIKHLFDVEGVAFVLLVNRNQIESYIRTVYGNVDADAYLLKFGNLFVDLPRQQPAFSFQYENGRKEYCQRLFSHYGISGRVRDGGFLVRSAGSLVDYFDMTLREIERAFTVMALYYISLPQQELTNEFLISMLSILKVKKPSLYQQLSMDTVSVAHFFEETGLDGLKNERSDGVDPEWAKEILQFCLMSDDELAKAIKNADGTENTQSRLGRMGHWLIPYNMNRKKTIPFFCSRLDRFSAQPQ
ncbi:MAG: P-loop NTPase fold protein [Verrucomicrobiota bacterium]|jgi:hypothetical protein